MPHSLDVLQLLTLIEIKAVLVQNSWKTSNSKILFDFICNYIPHTNGVAKYAPYGLRKLEAGLLRDGFSRKDVVVAHPNHIEKFIGPETQVVGTYEMDPLGMGPVTMTFTYGRKQMSYDEYYNTELTS